MNRDLRGWWLSALTAVGALAYAWVGLNAQDLARPAGLAGAAAILAALAVAAPRTAPRTAPGTQGRPGRPGVAAALLVLGTLPLAVLTWWSIVTPLLAVLTLLFGAALVRAAREGAGPSASG